MLRLYDVVKEKLGDKYKLITNQVRLDDKPGAVGIFIYESSNDSEYMDGTTEYESIKIHVEVNSIKYEDEIDINGNLVMDGMTKGINEAINYLRDFVYKMEREQTNVVGIELVDCQHVGPRAFPIGKNGCNTQICVCNIDVKYLID